jgi:hypothetical protein
LDGDIYEMGEELGKRSAGSSTGRHFVSLGIDIIILTHMAGAHQVVTEIYDIREREISFRNLVYTSAVA